MKTRVTFSMDPAVARRAKQLAYARRTSVSAMMEDFVRSAPISARDARSPFSRRWVGKFHAAKSSKPDPRLEALKARYQLNS